MGRARRAAETKRFWPPGETLVCCSCPDRNGAADCERKWSQSAGCISLSVWRAWAWPRRQNNWAPADDVGGPASLAAGRGNDALASDQHEQQGRSSTSASNNPARGYAGDFTLLPNCLLWPTAASAAAAAAAPNKTTREPGRWAAEFEAAAGPRSPNPLGRQVGGGGGRPRRQRREAGARPDEHQDGPRMQSRRQPSEQVETIIHFTMAAPRTTTIASSEIKFPFGFAGTDSSSRWPAAIVLAARKAAPLVGQLAATAAAGRPLVYSCDFCAARPATQAGAQLDGELLLALPRAADQNNRSGARMRDAASRAAPDEPKELEGDDEDEDEHDDSLTRHAEDAARVLERLAAQQRGAGGKQSTAPARRAPVRAQADGRSRGPAGEDEKFIRSPGGARAGAHKVETGPARRSMPASSRLSEPAGSGEAPSGAGRAPANWKLDEGASLCCRPATATTRPRPRVSQARKVRTRVPLEAAPLSMGIRRPLGAGGQRAAVRAELASEHSDQMEPNGNNRRAAWADRHYRRRDNKRPAAISGAGGGADEPAMASQLDADRKAARAFEALPVAPPANDCAKTSAPAPAAGSLMEGRRRARRHVIEARMQNGPSGELRRANDAAPAWPAQPAESNKPNFAHLQLMGASAKQSDGRVDESIWAPGAATSAPPIQKRHRPAPPSDELREANSESGRSNNEKDDYAPISTASGARKGVAAALARSANTITTRRARHASAQQAELIESSRGAGRHQDGGAAAAQADTSGAPVCELFHDKTYVVYSALGSFYIPALIMVFFYSRIYLVASRAQKAMQRGYMTTKWPPMRTSAASSSWQAQGGTATSSPLRRDNSCNDSRSRSLARGVVAKWNQHKLANSNGGERNNLPGASSARQPNGHLMQAAAAECNSSISGYLASASSNGAAGNECVPCEPERVTLRIHRRVEPPSEDSTLGADQQPAAAAAAAASSLSFDRLSQSSGASRGSRRSGAHADKSSSAPLNGESIKSLLSRGVKSLGRHATATISNSTTQSSDQSQSQLIQLTALERSQATNRANGERRTRFSFDKQAAGQGADTKRASCPPKVSAASGIGTHTEPAARSLNVTRSSPASQMSSMEASSREQAARSESIQTTTIDEEERDEGAALERKEPGTLGPGTGRKQAPDGSNRRNSSADKQPGRVDVTAARHCRCLRRTQTECSHQLARQHADRKPHHHRTQQQLHHHHHHRHHHKRDGCCRHRRQSEAAKSVFGVETGKRVAEQAGEEGPTESPSIEFIDEIDSMESVQIVIQLEPDDDQLRALNSNSQPEIASQDARADRMLEVSKSERSRSVDVTPSEPQIKRPLAMPAPPIVLVNWDPASGQAESLLSSDTPPAQSISELCEQRADPQQSLTGSGLSLVSNIPSQVRKQSIMLLSSITSRSSQTLRRLSMVAAHPVDSLRRSKSRAESRCRRTAADPSDHSCSSSAPSHDEQEDGSAERAVQQVADGDRLKRANCSQVGASEATSERNQMLPERGGKWRRSRKKRKRRKQERAERKREKQRSNSLAVWPNQQQAICRKKTLDDYLMAVAGIDSSSNSSDSRSASDHEDDEDEEEEDEEEEEEDEEESDLEQGRSLASMLRREHLLIPAITVASPPGDRDQQPARTSPVASRNPDTARSRPQVASNSLALDFEASGQSSSARTSIVSFRSCGGAVCASTPTASNEQTAARRQSVELKRKTIDLSLDGKVKRAERLPPTSGLHRQGALYESATSQRANSQAHIELLADEEPKPAELSGQLEVDIELAPPAASHSPDLFRLEQARAIKRSPVTGGVTRANEAQRNQLQMDQQSPSKSQQPARRRGAKRTSRWHAKRLRAETKAAKTVAIIVGGFIFCWLPFFTAYLARALICASPACIPQTWLSLFIWLGYLNSAINPVIYGLFSADFRHAFKNIVCQCRWRGHAHGAHRGSPRSMGLGRAGAGNERPGAHNTATVSMLVDNILKSIV